MQGIAVSKSIINTDYKENKIQKMTKPVQWWHLFLSFIGTMVGIAGFYMMATKTMEEKTEEKAKLFENHEQRIKFIEQSMQEYREDKKEMKSDIKQILIILQNKQDRK